MMILKTSLTALLSIAELFILTKIMGKRQISQLSLFDYINGITIGSIAAEMAVSSYDRILKPAVAMLIYGLVAVIFSLASNKSINLRRILVGKSTVLMDNGKIYRNSLSKSGLDLNEFLTQCRIAGYFNIDDLQTVIIEANGQLSFLPKANASPVKIEDMNIIKNESKLCVVVISDGKILHKNLSSVGKDENWLKNQLKSSNITSPEEVFVAFYDGEKLSLYKREVNNSNTDYFC